MFSPVIIEALCRRPAGQNVITIGSAAYDFRDDGTGRQIAKVSDEAHAQRLLSITEGYRFAGAAIETPAAVLPAATGLQGTGEAGTTVAEGQATPPAGDAPKTDAPAGDPPTDGEVEVMDLGGLRALFKAELGKIPSPKHSAELLVAQIIAARETAREAAANAQA